MRGTQREILRASGGSQDILVLAVVVSQYRSSVVPSQCLESILCLIVADYGMLIQSNGLKICSSSSNHIQSATATSGLGAPSDVA